MAAALAAFLRRARWTKWSWQRACPFEAFAKEAIIFTNALSALALKC